jgi:hypothetical protein
MKESIYLNKLLIGLATAPGLICIIIMASVASNSIWITIFFGFLGLWLLGFLYNLTVVNVSRKYHNNLALKTYIVFVAIQLIIIVTVLLLFKY